MPSSRYQCVGAIDVPPTCPPPPASCPSSSVPCCFPMSQPSASTACRWYAKRNAGALPKQPPGHPWDPRGWQDAFQCPLPDPTVFKLQTHHPYINTHANPLINLQVCLLSAPLSVIGSLAFGALQLAMSKRAHEG
jgi:hypothetical protein